MNDIIRCSVVSAICAIKCACKATSSAGRQTWHYKTEATHCYSSACLGPLRSAYARFLIADVGTVNTIKNIGVHSKQIPKFVLPDAHIQHTTQNIASCSNDLTCRIGDTRMKMRPDMMIVEMTYTEQHTNIPHDTDTGPRLPNLQRPILKSKARTVTIVKRDYCSDVSFLEKV